MLLSPEFIIFRVEIDGKEYLVRPNTLYLDHPWTPKKQSAKLNIFSSLQSFKCGYLSGEISVTSADVIGVEAIDTVDPIPLNTILAACNELENINLRADIGVIYRNIAPILHRLMEAMEDFEHIHDLRRYETAYEDINDLIHDCSKCRPDMSELERSNFVRDLKERVSVRVSRLIELASYGIFV